MEDFVCGDEVVVRLNARVDGWLGGLKVLFENRRVVDMNCSYLRGCCDAEAVAGCGIDGVVEEDDSQLKLMGESSKRKGARFAFGRRQPLAAFIKARPHADSVNNIHMPLSYFTCPRSFTIGTRSVLVWIALLYSSSSHDKDF